MILIYIKGDVLMVSKKNIFLAALFTLFSFTCIMHARKAQSARDARKAKKVCENAECTLPNCTCYCGVKCGPRPITKDDKPRYDKKTGKCFCADRDPGFYEKNNCASVDAEKEAEEQE